MSDTRPEIRKFLEQTSLPFEVWPCDPGVLIQQPAAEVVAALAKRQ